MSWASKTYTFSPSTTAASAEVNQNFDDAFSAINTAMPTGGIILWSGSIASIPSGWYLCNGSNSTPDLRNKFVIGAGDSYAVAATGGADSINLQHSHTVNSHTHTFSGTTDVASNNYRRGSDDALLVGDHTHTFSGTTDASAPGTDNQLSASQSILPPYYALAWIMKS
jgi:hypothetical protein